MRARFFYSAAVLIVLGAVYLLDKALNLLNRPSDSPVFAGVAIILAIFILLPSAIWWAWHHHVTPHGIVTASPSSAKEKDGHS